jgi:hypothetical protein
MNERSFSRIAKARWRVKAAVKWTIAAFGRAYGFLPARFFTRRPRSIVLLLRTNRSAPV